MRNFRVTDEHWGDEHWNIGHIGDVDAYDAFHLGRDGVLEIITYYAWKGNAFWEPTFPRWSTL